MKLNNYAIYAIYVNLDYDIQLVCLGPVGFFFCLLFCLSLPETAILLRSLVKGAKFDQSKWRVWIAVKEAVVNKNTLGVIFV